MEKSRAIELLEHLAWDRDIDKNPYGDALNMAIDALKAQLFQKGTTFDTLSMIETGITATNSNDVYSLGMRNGMRWCKSLIDGVEPKFEEMSVDNGKELPTIQPEKAQLSCEGTTSDTISRQWLLECVDEGWIKFDTEKDANRFIHLVRDIAPTAQPVVTDTNVGDIISRQAAIDAIEKMNIPEDMCVFGILSHIEVEIATLPTIQPEPQWIPVSERLPESGAYCLFTVFEHDSELEATTIETVYGCFHDYGERRYWSWEDEVGKCCIEGEEQLDGYHDEIIEKVLAWMPLPEAYKPNK